jgi:hypothetical protein
MHALISEFVPLHELLQFILFCQGWSNIIKYDFIKTPRTHIKHGINEIYK